MHNWYSTCASGPMCWGILGMSVAVVCNAEGFAFTAGKPRPVQELGRLIQANTLIICLFVCVNKHKDRTLQINTDGLSPPYRFLPIALGRDHDTHVHRWLVKS